MSTIDGWLARTYSMTVLVVPPPFRRVATGVGPWQEMHTLPQSAAPSMATGVTLTGREGRLEPAGLLAVTVHE